MTLGFQDNPQNILGADSADNQFSSANVAANANGSVIERIEYVQTVVDAITTGNVILQGAADAGTSSTTVIPIAALAGYGDDFFNTRFYLQVLHNDNSAGNAPEAQVRQITDYVSATGTFTCTAFSAAVEASDLCLILHESAVLVGRDDADNTAATTNVAANADGSLLERLEAIKDQIDAVDNFVDTEIAAIKAVTDALPNAGALTTIDANVDAILERVSGTDSVANVLGANDNDNGFDSSLVAANADGSLLERLEAIKDQVDAVDNYVDGANLEKLTATADGGTNAYPDSVAQESVVAYILSKSANPVTTSYDNTTDSLEAISDKITVVDDYIDGANLELLTSAADGAGNFPAAVVDQSVVSKILSKVAGGDTSSYDNTTDSLEAISDKIDTVDDYIDGANLEKLTSAADGGTNAYPDSVAQESVFAYLMSKSADPVVTSFDNTTDSLEAISDKITAVDDFVDTEVTAIQTAVDAFAAGGGDGKALVRKTVTFSNTAADVDLFTVTGGVAYKLYVFCTTNVESAAGCNIGVDHNSAAVIADTDCTTLEANDVWHDATPDAAIELESVAAKRVAYGGTITLDVEGAKQVDSGVLVFVCIYTPLTSDGAVAVAA